MGIYSVKPAFRRLLRPVVPRLVRAGISADALTWSGLVFSGMTGAALWLGRGGGAWLLAIPVGALLRTATNALDGLVAIEAGTARAFGEVFNEVADRAGDAVIFLPAMAVVGVPDPLVAATVAAVLITSFAGNAARGAGGERVYAGVMGKPDRMLLVGIAALVAFAVEDHSMVFEVMFWVMLVGSIATFGARIRAAHRQFE